VYLLAEIVKNYNNNNFSSIVPHPKLTKEMNRVFFSKVRKENLMDKLQPENCLRFVINLQEIRIREDVAFGDILVGDWNGVCASFITKISPTMLYKTLVVVYEVSSVSLF
jgi:hypothetical protein